MYWEATWSEAFSSSAQLSLKIDTHAVTHRNVPNTRFKRTSAHTWLVFTLYSSRGFSLHLKRGWKTENILSFNAKVAENLEMTTAVFWTATWWRCWAACWAGFIFVIFTWHPLSRHCPLSDCHRRSIDLWLCSSLGPWWPSLLVLLLLLRIGLHLLFQVDHLFPWKHMRVTACWSDRKAVLCWLRFWRYL